MKVETSRLLAINAGSSSIKFAVHEAGGSIRLLIRGKVDRIGLTGTRLEITEGRTGGRRRRNVAAPDLKAAIHAILAWLEAEDHTGSIRAVGHRVVHGMARSAPQRVTPGLIRELKRYSSFAPEHLPGEISIIEELCARLPSVPQVACFDTAFHRGMPRVAKLLPIPRKMTRGGIERYGFHGLSYEFMLGELERLGDRAASKGRVVLAHLGNGASLAAILDGRSVDTSMGFTPAAGLVMGTRTGDVDPGVLSYLAQRKGMSEGELARMVNHQSGLLGVSGTSSDMRDLLAREGRDARAAEAVELFCYQARKWIGAYAAALGGLDTLVFSGGIGENAAAVRERICAGLGFLGLEIDPKRNSRGASRISRRRSRVSVRVVKTDEEYVIAHSVARLLRLRARGRNKS
jgi:acetate kinase